MNGTPPVEHGICQRVVEVVELAFASNGLSVEVHGNWLGEHDGTPKGVDSTGAASKVFVTVSPRAYDSYSSCMAEIAVRLEAAIRADDDITGDLAAVIYGRIVDVLQLWHADFQAMKANLALPGFAPRGLVLGRGGTWRQVEDPLGWEIALDFTVAGTVATPSTPTTTTNN